ncbi:hypothetical protein [Isoptericola rhizosphaerae]|uniref:hypothetical protein n=1 Tax=Isoptericola rhizosphaerae TaxID=3377837 RepID=UPI00383AC61E
MPRRSRVESDTLRGALDMASRTYGPDVRIVSAERVITGGFAGLFGRQRYEVEVEVPDVHPMSAAKRPGASLESRRSGIAVLLDEADEADDLDTSPGVDREVSTGGQEFAELLSGLIAETAAPTTATEIDGPSARPGDLVALVGLADDAVPVVRDMAAQLGMLPACAGLARTDGMLRVDGSRDAVEARAHGVRSGVSVAVAVGVGLDGTSAPGLIEQLGPEQVWVVVDASRKPEDTRAWVDAVRQAAPVRAMAIVGRELTATPGSVAAIGLPEGWRSAVVEPGA